MPEETNAMRRPTSASEPPRSELRIADLKARRPGASRMLNVKIPHHLAVAVDHLARRLDSSKQSVLVALLNEGLAAAGTKVRRSS